MPIETAHARLYDHSLDRRPVDGSLRTYGLTPARCVDGGLRITRGRMTAGEARHSASAPRQPPTLPITSVVTGDVQRNVGKARAGLTKSRLHRSAPGDVAMSTIRPVRRPSLLMAAALLLALFGCGGQTATPDGIRAERSATGSAATEISHCRPPSPITETSSGLEIKATSRGGTVWALLEGPAVTRTRPPTIVAGRPVKVIWRATGSGDLAVVAVDEEGLTLTSTPQAHTGSTWIRPGDEWGSGFTFPHGGCWELLATRGGTRGGTRGTAWLVVASA